MISYPSYLSAAPYDLTDARAEADLKEMHSDGKNWLRLYLQEDVETLQMMKQHHVHLRNPETNLREPLAACRNKANPKECKAHIPRNTWLVERAAVLCQRLLYHMDLARRGRRCQIGSLHGPMNHECLNATHSAMLAAQRCNSDVQLPYRFPIIPGTHLCTDTQCLKVSDKVIMYSDRSRCASGLCM